MIGVQANGPSIRMRISGLVKFGGAASLGGATLAGFDLPTAQVLFQKRGKLDQIRAKAKPGVSPERLAGRDRVDPPTRNTGAHRRTAQAKEDAKDTESFLSFLQGFLLAFGGIALFVGAFVIANSLSITIAQRTRELATLRTLGASRRQVLGSIFVEALVIGILASIAGILVGLALGDRPVQALRRGRLHAAEQRARAAAAHGRRRDARRHPRHAARKPPACDPRDPRPADLRGPRGRDAAAGAAPPLSHAVGDHAHRARLRGARVRALRQRPRDDAGAPVHGARDAADLLRRRPAVGPDRAAVRVGAGLAAREVRRSAGRARARQRASQSSADGVDRVRPDDRAGPGDARLGAGRGDHDDVPRRGERPLDQRLRGHRPEQLLADPDRGRRCGREDARRRGDRQRARRRRARCSAR